MIAAKSKWVVFHFDSRVSIIIEVRQRIVLDVAVQVKTLWVAKIGVRNSRRCCAPVWRIESRQAPVEPAGAKVVGNDVGIAFLAGEFVILRAGIDIHILLPAPREVIGNNILDRM